MTSPRFPAAPEQLPPTPISDLDTAIARLGDRKEGWVATPLDRRLAYLRECLQSLEAIAPEWVHDVCRVKGITPRDNLAGEEWIAGPMTTARNVRLLIAALEQDAAPTPPAVYTRPSGQSVARIVPAEAKEKLLFAGFSAEVWIEPGQTPTQGLAYRERPAGRLCLVLGAGNVSSIPPMDILYKLFVENQVCLLKMNPVNEVVGPHLEKAFRPLIENGFLSIVYGGGEVGAYLAEHADIDTLHMTGSDRTYDAIVWGSDAEERSRRKAADDPRNTKPFSAELGCVTPVLVVPGKWKPADLDFQARHIASMVAQNASFNCNAAKVLVTARGWPQRTELLQAVRHHLARMEPRRAYYPGAEARYEAFLKQYPHAEALSRSPHDVVPWTFIPEVPPQKGEYALENEAFCGVLAECALDAAEPDEFLETAVHFANEACWGTLSCMLLIDEASRKRYADELDSAVEQLKYGGVAVNAWAAVLYGLVSPSWGAFPGHTRQDIQSGVGVVHNTFLFDHPQKSVLHAPFRIRPTPVWFTDHRNLRNTGRRLLHMETKPSWSNTLRVVPAAIKG